jgi:hypothetical protein
VRAASVKRQGLTEDVLNAGIADPETSGLFDERDQAILRFIDKVDQRTADVDRADYDELLEHISYEELIELMTFLVLNLGMHIVFSTLDFYPMFDPDGNLVTQEESRRIYGAVPAPLAGESD